MQDAARDNAPPWFREPLVWMLIAIPGSAVLMGVVMISLAVSTFDGLVEDDYYKKGMRIDQLLARDAAAAQFGLRASMEFTADGQVEVALEGNERFRAPAAITLRLLNATRDASDRTFDLRAIAPGRYRAAARPPGPGLWNVSVEHALWRLTGRLPDERGRLLLSGCSGIC